MQCAGERGVSASVQSGDLTWRGKSHSVHSKQGVLPGSGVLLLPPEWGEHRRAWLWLRSAKPKDFDAKVARRDAGLFVGQ